MTTHHALTDRDRRVLDREVRRCERAARREGWVGEWWLQVGDIDSIIRVRRGTLDGGKLTAAEGEYLGIPRWAGAHVDWQGAEEEQS